MLAVYNTFGDLTKCEVGTFWCLLASHPASNNGQSLWNRRRKRYRFKNIISHGGPKERHKRVARVMQHLGREMNEVEIHFMHYSTKWSDRFPFKME